jgi:hypothetical protein
MNKSSIKISPNRKMMIADKILRAFKNLVRSNKIEGIQVDVDNYSNGREAGHKLRVYGPVKNLHSICFSEYRSSDRIAVYVNERIPDLSSGISDESYRNAEMFNPNEYDKVAKYIYKVIKEHVDKKSAIIDSILKKSEVSNNVKSAFDHELKPRFKIKFDKLFEELENFLYDVNELKIKPETLKYSIMRYCGTNESQNDFAKKLVKYAYDWIERLKKNFL